MKKKYIVELTDEDRQTLEKMISSGKASARKLTHARILLKADSSQRETIWFDEQISEALNVDTSTVGRVRKRFVEEGLESALNRNKPRRVYQRKLDDNGGAHLIALACGQTPKGYQKWSLWLLSKRMVELNYADSISYETVRQTLKKRN